jgi:hypothetical protein
MTVEWLEDSLRARRLVPPMPRHYLSISLQVGRMGGWRGVQVACVGPLQRISYMMVQVGGREFRRGWGLGGWGVGGLGFGKVGVCTRRSGTSVRGRTCTVAPRLQTTHRASIPFHQRPTPDSSSLQADLLNQSHQTQARQDVVRTDRHGDPWVEPLDEDGRDMAALLGRLVDRCGRVWKGVEGCGRVRKGAEGCGRVWKAWKVGCGWVWTRLGVDGFDVLVTLNP